MMTRNSQRIALPLLLAVLGSAVVPFLVQAADSPGIAQRDAELDNLLTQKARDIFERVKLVDGQARSRRVDVVADIDKGVVTISLDRSFLPDNHGPSYEDQTSEINFGLLHWAEQVAPFSSVIHLYDGKPAEYYFPEIKAQTMRQEKQGRSDGGGGLQRFEEGAESVRNRTDIPQRASPRAS
ncbi:hypothetical protein C1925_10625 [Stenotrophomonas sp. SAU14A_NAIMI4_5]|uniref:hypothetical protein n=1 Tax=Stenotrophomonas sp. SAU14A_NAIMI4_5 TaxID=2072413 RepID=UPI000D53FEA4|nr:hypothetical protein [Stenotrophomonas sp. SAU14A_NAIMI4_5]AWH49570.1 hypothetical protein C1925_10625 [Stenotrophomonas sp. SAU14A_NAIMI4_5]